jgi:hypothetical protein
MKRFRLLCLVAAGALCVASGQAVTASAMFVGLSTSQDPTSLHPATLHDRDGDGLSNAWERRWNVSDPRVPDTNRNGVPDGAEDPDGDGLSNLGEQLVGTNPTTSDTDHDGIDDAHDDANGNGVRDGLDQDHRPLPTHLTPTLQDAPRDVPQGLRDGCHTPPGSATVHACVYGDRTAARTIVLFGDSHALQWEPALIRVAQRSHRRLVAITKSGCPSVDVRFRALARLGDRGPCHRWRWRAIEWINAHPPDLVIVSNDRAYVVVDSAGRVLPQNLSWEGGLRRTLASLPTSSARLVIADTVRFDWEPVSCLMRNRQDIGRCETTREEGLSPLHNAAEIAAAKAEHAEFVDLGGLVCPYDPCPVVMGDLMMWRDHHHLTATFSRSVWRGVETAIKEEVAAT